MGKLMAMQLMAYLKQQKVGVPDFARSINEPVGTIHKIAYRQRQPSLTLALKITDATSGEVQPADMALEQPAEQTSKAA